MWAIQLTRGEERVSLYLRWSPAEVARTLHGDIPFPDRFCFSSRPQTFDTREGAEAFLARAVESGDLASLVARSVVVEVSP